MVTNDDIKLKLKARREGKKPNYYKEKKEKLKNEGLLCVRGKGAGNYLMLENTGIKTGDGQFVPYNAIDNIEDSIDWSPKIKLYYASWQGTPRVIKINFNNEQIIMKNVKENEAINFVKVVREHIFGDYKPNSKTCQNCGTENEDNASFCMNCGEQIEEDEIFEGIKEHEEKSQNNIIKEETLINTTQQIKEAKDLLDMGAITEEEFQEIKNKYLKEN